MVNKLVRLLSTFFYVGFFPGAPGSIASAVGVLIAVIFNQSILVYTSVFFIITLVGFWVSGKMEELAQEKDPSCVVIDEVSGVMLAFFLLPVTPAVIITAFFLFRAFDMFKIYPANKFESLGGGTGIMMDDLVAGLYTNIIMHVAIRLAGVI